jgi:hypothetical protein
MAGYIAMRKRPSDAYLEKAQFLNQEETERLLSRTRSKLIRRLEDEKLSALDVVAIQLEIEDEDLNEWREKWAELKRK